MTVLKSARDQLNQPGTVNQMVVMSGSDRDKLLSLVNTAASPFHVSRIQRMPPLGAGLHGPCGGPDGAQTESACTSFCAVPSPVNAPTGCGQSGDLCPVRTTTLIPNEYT